MEKETGSRNKWPAFGRSSHGKGVFGQRPKTASETLALPEINCMDTAKLQETQSTIRFSAKLFRPEATEKIGSWTLLTLPKNASAKLPSRGMTMVEGTINGFPFRAALEPDGKGSHWLRVNKAMQDAAGADAGDTVTVEITRTGEEPELQGANGSTQSPGRRPAGAGIVGGYHTHGAAGLDSLDQFSQATGNAQGPDRERLRHAGIWKATGLLFWRSKLAEERSRNSRRDMASVAGLRKLNYRGLAT